jgi:hypothetical protein
MPGKLHRGMQLIGATEFLSQGALDAFEGAREVKRGRGTRYEVVGSRSVVSEVLEALRELEREMDQGVGPAKDLGVESSQLRAAARQAMLPA